MMNRTPSTLTSLALGALMGTTSCGGADSDAAERAANAAERAADAAERAADAAERVEAATRALVPAPAPVAAMEGSATEGNPSTAVLPQNPMMMAPARPPMAPAGSGTPCVAPPGVSTTPSTIPEALGLLNSLPKPTSLPCFLQTLSRPLALYMTSSTQSLQPATGGERSPRTFVLRGALEMSIVLDGPAIATLEIAYRTEPARSIKTEILFPVARDVTPERFFDRVLVGDATECGNCHVAETREPFEGFPDGVFVSDVIPPYDIFEVDLESLRAEHSACDEQAEAQRCALLSALFDHGDVQRGELGNPGL